MEQTVRNSGHSFRKLAVYTVSTILVACIGVACAFFTYKATRGLFNKSDVPVKTKVSANSKMEESEIQTTVSFPLFKDNSTRVKFQMSDGDEFCVEFATVEPFFGVEVLTGQCDGIKLTLKSVDPESGKEKQVSYCSFSEIEDDSSLSFGFDETPAGQYVLYIESRGNSSVYVTNGNSFSTLYINAQKTDYALCSNIFFNKTDGTNAYMIEEEVQ